MELTHKQKKFCQLAAIGPYGDAWRAAYENNNPNINASAEGWRLRQDYKIQRRIVDIQTAAFKPVERPLDFLLNFWFQRMIYDPREITAWAIGACRHCHGDGHGYQWRLHEYMEALRQAEIADAPMPDIAGGFGYNSTKLAVPDCPECDGRGKGRAAFADTSDLSVSARAAFEGIKQTKDGLEIKMADKQKAAEQFGKLCGLDVVQIKTYVEAIPDAIELAALRNDPAGAANVYKMVTSGGSGRELLN